MWPDAKDDDVNVGWVRDTYDALTPYMAESICVNYLGNDDHSRVQAAYRPCGERIQQVKRAYDPDNVFHLNQNIAP